MLIGNIIAPFTAPQIAAPPVPAPSAPRLDKLDQQLLDQLRDAGSCPVWSLLNAVADEQVPHDRTAGRLLRLQLWDRLKRLRKLGLVFFMGRNRVSDKKATSTTRRQGTRRRRPTVARLASICVVSDAKASGRPGPRWPAIALENQAVGGTPQPNVLANEPDESKTAPDPAHVTQAAKFLACLPRNQPRKLTGWLAGEHCWKGRLLILADGEVAPLLWCSRGKVLLRNYRDMELPDYLLWGGKREHDVRFHKCPAAVLLGQQKRGVRERRSERKAEAVRRNGRQPPRPGSRPRGRPRSVDRVGTPVGG